MGQEFFRVAVRAVIVAVTLSAAPIYAADDEPDRGRALLDSFLNDVDAMSANFEQSLSDADGLLLETSRGGVKIRRPGQFRWTYDEPYAQVLVADGLNVWSYDVDLEQVTVKAQAEVLSNTPALLLSGTRTFDEEFRYIESFSDDGVLWVRLQPTTTDNGFTRVDLGFEDHELRRMAFRDTLEQTTLITLSDVDLNPALDASSFQFTVPAGVDLIGKPLVADSSNP